LCIGLIENPVLTLVSFKNHNFFYKRPKIMKPLLKSSFLIILQCTKTVLLKVSH
jgi:hypothetical protein